LGQKVALVEIYCSQQQQPIKIPDQKTSCPPSESLLYPVVNKEVEQQFSTVLRYDIVTREIFLLL
jgi:hypothetical protein